MAHNDWLDGFVQVPGGPEAVEGFLRDCFVPWARRLEKVEFQYDTIDGDLLGDWEVRLQEAGGRTSTYAFETRRLLPMMNRWRNGESVKFSCNRLGPDDPMGTTHQPEEIDLTLLPDHAERFMYFFLPAWKSEEASGDIKERCLAEVLPRFGVRYARRWCVKEAAVVVAKHMGENTLKVYERVRRLGK